MYNISREELKQIVSEALTEELKKYLLEEELTEKLDAEETFHISQIPDDVKKRQYVYYSAMLSVAGYGGPFMMIDDKLIAEEATYTTSVPETKKIMMQKFNLDAWQIGMQQGANGVELMFYVPDISNLRRQGVSILQGGEELPIIPFFESLFLFFANILDFLEFSKIFIRNYYS